MASQQISARKLPNMSSPSRPLLQQPIDGACAPRAVQACLAQTSVNESEAPARRTPLADLRFGLAWSNSLASDEVLVRAAIKHGAFHMLLETTLHHGMPFVEQQLVLMLADEDCALTDRAQADVRRKLSNIRRGLAAAGLAELD